MLHIDSIVLRAYVSLFSSYKRQLSIHTAWPIGSPYALIIQKEIAKYAKISTKVKCDLWQQLISIVWKKNTSDGIQLPVILFLYSSHKRRTVNHFVAVGNKHSTKQNSHFTMESLFSYSWIRIKNSNILFCHSWKSMQIDCFQNLHFTSKNWYSDRIFAPITAESHKSWEEKTNK